MLRTKSGNNVSKIGIGTWTINKENFETEVDALKFYFDNGINYIDVVLAYDGGLVLDVVAEFLKSVKREDIFINAFITFGCKEISDIEKQINFYLEKLGIDYLDAVSLHSLDAVGFSFDEYVLEINKLKQTGKFLSVGYSNLSPELLLQVKDDAVYFEGLYNLECKLNEDNKIIELCQENGIDFYAYQPLRRNRTAKQNYAELVSLAKKYDKTQNQILINWIVKHKNIGVLIKSSNKMHIKENIGSLDFEMSDDDYAVLDNFRNSEFDKVEVSFKTEDGKVRIDQLPNQKIGIL